MANTNKVYGYVTEKIVKMLEAGVIPWRKPWSGKMPSNYVSKKPYNGVNIFLLAAAPYSDHRYLSFKQVKDLGGNVKKGEKGHMVVFWKFLKKNETRKDGTVKNVTIPFLRYYTVFNVEQTENWVPREIPAVSETENLPIDAAEKVIANLPETPEVKGSLDRAYYNPSADFIGMPDRKVFESPEAYYSTLFHEVTHWTGNASRLNRFEKNESTIFGCETYSKEELVAEFGAAFLCALTGVNNAQVLENSAAYIGNWITRLKADDSLIISAASKGRKAVEWITKAEAETVADENGIEATKEPEPLEAVA